MVRYIFEAIWIYLAATLLLRISGRKSISQMTIPETVLIISIGTLIIQPVPDYGFGWNLAISAVLVAALMGVEYLQFKFNLLEQKLPNLEQNGFAEAVTGEPSPTAPDRLQ